MVRWLGTGRQDDEALGVGLGDFLLSFGPMTVAGLGLIMEMRWIMMSRGCLAGQDLDLDFGFGLELKWEMAIIPNR